MRNWITASKYTISNKANANLGSFVRTSNTFFNGGSFSGSSVTPSWRDHAKQWGKALESNAFEPHQFPSESNQGLWEEIQLSGFPNPEKWRTQERQVEPNGSVRDGKKAPAGHQRQVSISSIAGGDQSTPIEYLENIMMGVLFQLLAVVNYLHQRNIVHRDIRLETVYVD